ncbi:Adenylate cyclase [Pararobbsia alpina]|uniref:winged helix-turn-helix domain-containing protein n=1 Tax=Pararobbsia alpina TaxID=621374 RepID=UPI0039A59FD9
MSAEDRAVFRFDEFALDTASGTLRGAGGAEIMLRPKGYALLLYLLERPGVLHSRNALLDALWAGLAVTDDSLTQCVGDLRRALGDRATSVLRTLPRRGYVLATPVLRDIAPANTRVPALAPPKLEPGALLPDCDLLVFEALEPQSNDVEAQRFARFLGAELLRSFSRSEMVLVQTRATQPLPPESFLLSGAVRCGGEQPQLSLLLEEADNGRVVWADQVSLPPPNQREEALAVLFARLETLVMAEGLRRARHKPVPALRAYDFVRLGAALYGRGNEGEKQEAEQHFLHAIAMDRGIAIAHAYIAMILMNRLHVTRSQDRTIESRRALDFARQAVELKPRSAFAVAAFAYALARSRHWDTAAENARMAVGLSTLASVGPRTMAAVALLISGEADEALLALQPAIALESFGAAGPRTAFGTVLLATGKREEALVELRRAASHLPDFPPCLRSTVVAAVELGRLNEAREALARLRQVDPEWMGSLREFLSFMRDGLIIDRFVNAFAACGESVRNSAGPSLTAAGGTNRG